MIEGALLADRTIGAWQHWTAEATAYPLSICSAVPREVWATRGEEFAFSQHPIYLDRYSKHFALLLLDDAERRRLP